MYESPSVGLLTSGGPASVGTYAATVGVYGSVAWAYYAVTTALVWANVAAVTLAVAFAAVFNSGVFPIRE